MNSRRLYLRVLLKFLTFVALLALIAVFLNSFTPLFKRIFNSDSTQPALVSIDLADMRPNEIRKIRWQGKEVAVLQRKQVSNEQTDA